MHIRSHTRQIAPACIAGRAVAGALAQDSAYPYTGLSLGGSRAKFDQVGIDNRLLGPGLLTTAMAGDNDYRACGIFGGHQFNRYVGVEAAFFDLGHFKYSARLHACLQPDRRVDVDVSGKC